MTRDDRLYSSIGSILLNMGAITEDELQVAIKEQSFVLADTMLGLVMVKLGFCSQDDVERALQTQKMLRNKSVSDSAMAMADVALARKRRRSILLRRDRVAEKGAEILRTISGTEYVVVSPDILEKHGKTE